MADFDPAVYYVMENEGGYSDQAQDSGGVTDYGITLAFLKSIGKDGDLNNDGVVDAKDVQVMTRKEAERIYNKYWWDKYKYHYIKSQIVATKIFDMSVNMGAHRATFLFHQCVNKFNPLHGHADDHEITPSFSKIVNSIDEHKLTMCLTSASVQFYKNIVRRNPKNKVFLKGWLRRALKIPDVFTLKKQKDE